MPLSNINHSKKKRKREKILDPLEVESRNQRLEAIKRKRKETVEAVKRDLENKLSKRIAIKNLDLEEETRKFVKGITDRGKTINEKRMTKIRNDMKYIMEAGFMEVNAMTVLHKKLKFDNNNNKIIINNEIYNLSHNVHMVGWGREVIALGPSFERIIGDHLKSGWLVVPKETVSKMWSYVSWLPKMDTRITFLEAGSNNGLVNEESVKATQEIAEYCKKLKKQDILIVILSGGTKDLLCYPKHNVEIEEKMSVLGKLKAVGATPVEIDLVRKALSQVRGGNLARLAYPAKVITFIMSDISGDPIKEIAGGPTVNDPGIIKAGSILKKYHLDSEVPISVKNALADINVRDDDPLLDKNNMFKFVSYHVIASINDALDGMATAAFRLGLVPLKLSSSCVNYAKIVGREYAKIAALLIMAAENKITKLELYDLMFDSPVLPLSEEKVREIFPSAQRWGLGLCLLMGGRSITKLSPQPGQGGPNQELALYFALYWYLKRERYPLLKQYIVWLLSGSTTGYDGNTDVTGAYGYDGIVTEVYQRFKDFTVQTQQTLSKYRNLLKKDPNGEETKKTLDKFKYLEAEKAKIMSILPDKVLEDNDTNSLFLSINDGNELLQIGKNQGNVLSNVRDLHVIRIVKAFH